MPSTERVVTHSNGETRVSWQRFEVGCENGPYSQSNLEVIGDGHYWVENLTGKSGWAGDNREKKGH